MTVKYDHDDCHCTRIEGKKKEHSQKRDAGTQSIKGLLHVTSHCTLYSLAIQKEVSRTTLELLGSLLEI